jgi:hypothetical protein
MSNWKIQPDCKDGLHLVDTTLGSSMEVWFRVVSTGVPEYKVELEIEVYDGENESQCIYVSKSFAGKIADMLRRLT